jgi:hypothetical protein
MVVKRQQLVKLVETGVLDSQRDLSAARSTHTDGDLATYFDSNLRDFIPLVDSLPDWLALVRPADELRDQSKQAVLDITLSSIAEAVFATELEAGTDPEMVSAARAELASIVINVRERLSSASTELDTQSEDDRARSTMAIIHDYLHNHYKLKNMPFPERSFSPSLVTHALECSSICFIWHELAYQLELPITVVRALVSSNDLPGAKHGKALHNFVHWKGSSNSSASGSDHGVYWEPLAGNHTHPVYTKEYLGGLTFLPFNPDFFVARQALLGNRRYFSNGSALLYDAEELAGWQAEIIERAQSIAPSDPVIPLATGNALEAIRIATAQGAPPKFIQWLEEFETP